MKTLSIEHRRNLSKAISEVNKIKKSKSDAYGDANRNEVIKELRDILCRDCDTDKKTQCDRLSQERVRNGRTITCMRRKFKPTGEIEINTYA